MSKINKHYEYEGVTAYQFICPGCRAAGMKHLLDHHSFFVPPWTFNGDFEKPTVGGSVLMMPTPTVDDDYKPITTPRCHSLIADGRIQFLADCTHPLAGQTVELPDWKG